MSGGTGHAHADRSSTSHAVLDEKSRRRKANKVLAVLGGEIDLTAARLLDIGTGSGYIANEMARTAREVHSVDVVDQRRTSDGFTFTQVTDERLPFDDGFFDVVVSNHVVEHVGDQRLHLSELSRVLTATGVIYLATPNRYWITDPHYRLPLLPVLPRGVAGSFIRLAGRGDEWDVYPLSDRMVRELVPELEFEPVVPRLLKDPVGNGMDVGGALTRITRRLPDGLLAASQHVSPTLIYLGRKVPGDVAATSE